MIGYIILDIDDYIWLYLINIGYIGSHGGADH